MRYWGYTVYRPFYYDNFRVIDMLRWAVIFLIIALVAALFGFGGIAGAAVGIAKILFFIFIVLFIISILIGGFAVKKIKNAVDETLHE